MIKRKGSPKTKQLEHSCNKYQIDYSKTKVNQINFFSSWISINSTLIQKVQKKNQIKIKKSRNEIQTSRIKN